MSGPLPCSLSSPFPLSPVPSLLSLASKGLLVLKELGLELETYIASEIDPDAVKVPQENSVNAVDDYKVKLCAVKVIFNEL